MCTVLLPSILDGVAGFLDDLQQPRGHELDQGLQVLSVKVYSLHFRPLSEQRYTLVISGPIDLNFSAMLPETFTFQRATVDSTATTEEAAIYISTPVRRRLQFT